MSQFLLMRLPRDNDSLNLHIIRANYLAHIQRHAELRNHPSPIGHGWEMMNGNCRPVRYTKLDLPAVLPQHPSKEQSVSQNYLNQILTQTADNCCYKIILVTYLMLLHETRIHETFSIKTKLYTCLK